MFNPEAFSPERQAQIAKMSAYDREQRRLALYDPETQEVGELRMISEHFRHNFNYTKRKMTEKWSKMKRKSKFFDEDNKEEKLENGEIFKTILTKGDHYRSSSMNDRVEVRLNINVIEGDYPIDIQKQKDDPDIVEIEEKTIETTDNEEKLLFTAANLHLKYYLFDETTFLGLDAVVESMNRKEKSEFVLYGVFLKNFFTFLRKFSKKTEEEINNLQHLFKQKPFQKDVTKGLMVKLNIELIETTRVLDIGNDGGVFKEQVQEPTEYDGLGWANESDHVVISVKLLKGHKSGEEVDYGQLETIWKEWDSKVQRILPYGVLKGMQEIKQSEVSLITILPKTVNDLYSQYATDRFREENELLEESELIYQVTNVKIQKVYKLLDKRVQYRLIAKGQEYEVKSPRTMQRVSFKLRWFVNKYKLNKVETLGNEQIERQRINRIFFLGMGCKNEGETSPLEVTEDYQSLAFIRTSTCQFPMFVEKVIKKLNRNKHVVVTTTDDELCFGLPELDMVLENMLLNDIQGSEHMNITNGEVLSKLEELKESNKPLKDQLAEIKQYYLDFKNKKADEEVEMEIELLLSYFESKDTYWDVEPSERRVLMKEYKEQGNVFYKNKCYEQAIECYRAGVRVYSNHNFNMIDEANVKTIVKPLKISLLLNLATACSKVSDKKSLKRTLEELDEFTKNDKDEEKLKIFLKKGSIELNLNNLVKGKEWLMKVQKIDPSFPGLKAEFKRLKGMIEASKEKTKKKYKGFLNKKGNEDVLATETSRSEPKNKKPESLDFTNIPREDWEKRAKEFYGIE